MSTSFPGEEARKAGRTNCNYSKQLEAAVVRRRSPCFSFGFYFSFWLARIRKGKKVEKSKCCETSVELSKKPASCGFHAILTRRDEFCWKKSKIHIKGLTRTNQYLLPAFGLEFNLNKLNSTTTVHSKMGR
jgi:hypothetical protein